MMAPLGGGAGDPGAPTSQLGDIDGGPSSPIGGPNSICCPSMCCDLHK
jgi:hypothetical protein